MKKILKSLVIGMSVAAICGGLRIGVARASFVDVPNYNPNFAAIMYVQEQGIVTGYPDGTFKPDQTINRAEFIKIIIGSIFDAKTIEDCQTSPARLFQDVPRKSWFAPYVCMSKYYDIISGYGDGTFQPTRQINFVESSKIISIAFDLPLGPSGPAWYEPYVLSIAAKNAIPPSVGRIEQSITRGEMAEMMFRLKVHPGMITLLKPVEAPQIDANKSEVIALINEERAKQGLDPVTESAFLDDTAQKYSLQMQEENFFAHISPGGEDEFDRVSASGYLQAYNACNCNKSYTIGENIAKGQQTPVEVMNGWMNSPEHRANILNPDFSEVGIGITKIIPRPDENFVGFLWVQNFGHVSLYIKKKPNVTSKASH